MTYTFLIDTYETERLKTLSMWSIFSDGDMGFRPHPTDRRGRSVREQMVHQCMSENLWFLNIFGIDVGAPPLPTSETRIAFLTQYAEDSGKRLEVLRNKNNAWWEESVSFFGEPRSRAWVMLRRISHSAHHRGQLAALVRMLNRDLHSTYGPTADTGGLMQSKAPTIYAYTSIEGLLDGESSGGAKASLPGPGDAPSTERA
jgi:uncharacterized damage-inducible protein DinB